MLVDSHFVHSQLGALAQLADPRIRGLQLILQLLVRRRSNRFDLFAATPPFDVEGLSHLIEKALVLDHDYRRERIAAMSATVHRYDVFTWVDQILADAKQAAVAARV